MDQSDIDIYNQSGAIPYRVKGDELQLLIITSRNGKRWIFPKGIIDQGMTAAESALAESFEEAGVEGSLLPGPIGKFKYKKWGGTCIVRVFLMKVDKIHDDWPEDDFRVRKWVSRSEAEKVVSPSKLRKLVKKIPNDLG
jgi:8-oxo-dGTP pyrophosphatase MutT (NUDIX family)